MISSSFYLCLCAFFLLLSPWVAEGALFLPSFRSAALAMSNSNRVNRQCADILASAAVIDPSQKAVATTPATALPPKKKSTWRSILPILCSAFCAAAIMYPVDLVRALQMANAGMGLTTKELLVNFHKAHGLKGFFTQGLAPELARSTWMRFIKFALFPMVHMAMFKIPEGKGNEATKALAAIVASVPEALSIMPLELSKIALQLDTANIYNNNMFKAMSTLYQQYGFNIFNVGYLGVQYRQAAWSAGYFASFKFFEKQVNKGFEKMNINTQGNPLAKTFSQLLSGFFAGVFGAAINTPGDTLRSTLQKKVLQTSVNGLNSQINLLTVGKDIVKARGFGGLYAGFTFKAFHLGGGGALMAFLVPFFTSVFEEK